jgi:hypothetical protein
MPDDNKGYIPDDTCEQTYGASVPNDLQPGGLNPDAARVGFQALWRIGAESHILRRHDIMNRNIDKYIMPDGKKEFTIPRILRWNILFIERSTCQSHENIKKADIGHR